MPKAVCIKQRVAGLALCGVATPAQPPADLPSVMTMVQDQALGIGTDGTPSGVELGELRPTTSHIPGCTRVTLLVNRQPHVFSDDPGFHLLGRFLSWHHP